jgi:hypothetical protein
LETEARTPACHIAATILLGLENPVANTLWHVLRARFSFDILPRDTIKQGNRLAQTTNRRRAARKIFGREREC